MTKRASSYVLSNVPQLHGRHELAPGVVLVGLPSGLGALTTPGSFIALLYKKTRPDDASMMIQFSLMHGSRVGAEVLVAPEAHDQFNECPEAALAIKMLLQCAGFGNAEIPAAFSMPLSELSDVPDGSVEMTSLDVLKGWMRFRFGDGSSEDVLRDAQSVWPVFMDFFYGEESQRFQLALQAVEASRYAHNIRFALAQLWIAPETVFGTRGSETTFKIASAWAAADAEFGQERVQLQRRLTKLYDVRSRAVHGDAGDLDAFARGYEETYHRFMHCLWTFLRRRAFPKPRQLLDAVFGVDEDDGD